MGAASATHVSDPDCTPRFNADRLYRISEDFSSKLPIVYCPIYNISFLGMEKLHPFDSGKWGRVFAILKEGKMITEDSDVVAPEEASAEELAQIHTGDYLKSLTWSVNVASITEIPPVALIPNSIVNRVVLKPLRYQTGGTVLAGRLAMEHGWSINIGGGFHHCSGEDGGGFCAYADISMCAKAMQDNFFANDENKNILILDLDAHQGNGHENDKRQKRIENVVIMDMYNKYIYPGDKRAARAIDRPVPLDMHTNDDTYLALLEENLRDMLGGEQPPRAIIYNAGTDILIGDPLGRLDITAEGIKTRDAIVFEAAIDKNIPIIMVTSGGYQQETASVIANSLMNLHDKNIIRPNLFNHLAPRSS